MGSCPATSSFLTVLREILDSRLTHKSYTQLANATPIPYQHSQRTLFLLMRMLLQCSTGSKDSVCHRQLSLLLLLQNISEGVINSLQRETGIHLLSEWTGINLEIFLFF